jgi:hypothetical protein
MSIPSIEWFRNPNLTEPTPVTVTRDGRVYGHIATWETTHVGMPGQNVRPPRSAADYGYFHVGQVSVLDDDRTVDVSCGKLTLDTGHAPVEEHVTAAAAASHYDNTGTAVANVCAGEDDFGIWFSGALAPGVDDLKRHKLKSSAVSGDWRPVNGNLELVAALMVNTPGFPIPRARVASAAELAPLVAANVVPNIVQEDTVMPETETKTFKTGDVVQLVASGTVAQVTEVTDEGYAVEVVASADELTEAPAAMIAALSSARTARTQMRSLTAAVEKMRADLEARDRADEAARLLSDVDL